MDKIGAETLKRMDKASFYNKQIFRLIEKHLRGEILEVGCGIGSFTQKLVSFGHVTAVDIEKFYITRTKKHMKGLASVGFGDVEQGKWFFPSTKKFDTIICLNVLEHIKNDKNALKNMYSLLKKGGKLVLLTPAHQAIYGSLDIGLGHERRYTTGGLSNLFKNIGYKVQDVYYFNWLGALGWGLNAKVLSRKVLPSKQLGLFSIAARITLFFEKFIKPKFGLSVFIVGEK